MAWPKGRRWTEEERAVRHRVMPEAERQARSLRQKGRVITWGAKIGAAKKGRHYPKISEAKKGIATSIQKGDKRSDEIKANIKAGFTPEGRKKISEANLGKTISDNHKAVLSTLRKVDGRHHFTGGDTADAYAEVLCPIGFIREYKFYYARGIHSCFQLDFAHIEGKICIEIDGPSHSNTQLYDQQRDEIVKHFGWRVIRIKNY